MNIVLWILKILAAVAFLAAGGSKLAGAAPMVATFEKLGVGQWFRYVTGLIEVVGAIGLLVPRLSFFAALLLTATMIGAVASHLLVLGGNPAPAVVLLILVAAIAWMSRGRATI